MIKKKKSLLTSNTLGDLLIPKKEKNKSRVVANRFKKALLINNYDIGESSDIYREGVERDKCPLIDLCVRASSPFGLVFSETKFPSFSLLFKKLNAKSKDSLEKIEAALQEALEIYPKRQTVGVTLKVGTNYFVYTGREPDAENLLRVRINNETRYIITLEELLNPTNETN